MAGRHRRHEKDAYVRWLRVGAAAAGLGAAFAIGNGVATAAPSTGPDTAKSGDPAKGANVRPAPHRLSADRAKPKLLAQGRLKNPTEKRMTTRARQDARKASIATTIAANTSAARDAAATARAEITRVASAITASVHEAQTAPRSPDRVRTELTSRLLAATEALGLNRVELQPKVQNSQTAAPTVAAEPSNPIDLTDLTSRQGVTVSRKDDTTVKVINGAFTDQTVATAADAAALFNQMAPQLGASAGFAEASAITVQHVGGAHGDADETFYRLHETVNGLPVLGSEVILATDADGKVTRLFNNHVSRVDGMDVIPAGKIDDENEAAAVAVAAYLGSAYPGQFRWIAPALIRVGMVKPELVVNAMDSTSPPDLVWRVVVDPPDAPDLLGTSTPNPGSTYLIDADGLGAGTVLVHTSTAQPLAVSAADLTGQSRQIDITRLNLLLFSLDYLRDPTRGITTYDTWYLFFGVGPVTPGIFVFRGPSGWETSAVSAHANVAEVYDYYSTVLGLTSYDGDGAAVNVSVGYNPQATWAEGYDNAYWDPGPQQLVFGDTADLEAAVDVVGHEYTHAVISYAIGDGGSPLDSGESGALNEAYADIMGTLIEGKDRDDPGRWLIGEDSTFDGGAVRNLVDPGSIETADGPYRETYADRYTEDGDEGGEHINSTIFSHAAYRMMTNPVNSNISDETWARVFYHSMFGLSAGADFADGREAVLSTIELEEYGFTDEQKLAVAAAFDEGGIG
jgi:bacillolysin